MRGSLGAPLPGLPHVPMIRLRYRSATGEARPWTLREIVQGKPLGHPSHAMMIHFPIAFYVAVTVFDVLTLSHRDPGLVHAATFLLLGAFAATVLAIVTGLVDWWQMVPGSRKRRAATLHMLVQVSAAVCFVAAFALRWPDRSASKAHLSWIALEAVGTATIFIGQYLGGRLVYEMGMRVSTGGSAGG